MKNITRMFHPEGQIFYQQSNQITEIFEYFVPFQFETLFQHTVK